MASKRTSESVLGAGASKKRKQTFLKSYESDYPWVQAAKENAKAFCKLCFVEINISHGRKHDTEVHVASAKQKSNKASAGKTDITAAMSDDDLQVIQAETLMTQFTAELNLPLTSADTFMKIVKHKFPDSKVTQQFHCGRNKTTCLVKELTKNQQATLVEKMKPRPFSPSTDSSNDKKSKQFLLMVWCGNNDGKIMSELFSVPVCEASATGENIFHLIQNAL